MYDGSGEITEGVGRGPWAVGHRGPRGEPERAGARRSTLAAPRARFGAGLQTNFFAALADGSLQLDGSWHSAFRTPAAQGCRLSGRRLPRSECWRAPCARRCRGLPSDLRLDRLASTGLARWCWRWRASRASPSGGRGRPWRARSREKRRGRAQSVRRAACGRLECPRVADAGLWESPPPSCRCSVDLSRMPCRGCFICSTSRLVKPVRELVASDFTRQRGSTPSVGEICGRSFGAGPVC